MNNPFTRLALGVALMLTVWAGNTADAPKPPAVKVAEEPIDWNRARELHRKAQNGEKLSPADQTYYDRAKRLREQGGGNANPPSTQRKPDAPARSFTPLTELGTGRYQGEDGGLYGGGRNEPPKELAALAQKETAKIRPLDREGKPSPSGKVVLLSIGMSNTTQEFSRFKQLADSDAQKSSALIIVDGAQGGQDAPRIADDAAKFWSVIDERLQAAGVTRQQVQVV